jgi:glycosyltransferase involved in cell wall biosynthesis
MEDPHMHKVLFVTPDLDYTGATTQLALLAQRLPRKQFDVMVCALGPKGRASHALEDQGVAVQTMDWNWRWDVAAVVRFRRFLATFNADVIHAWRPRGMHLMALAAGRNRCPLVVSYLAPWTGCTWSRLNRWQAHRAACIVVGGAVEAERFRQHGLDGKRIRMVPPGVEAAGSGQQAVGSRQWGQCVPGKVNLESAPRGDGCSSLPTAHCPLPTTGLPAARYLLCVGPLERSKGFVDAIWAFDVLRRVRPDLHLVIAGSGSDCSRLERFVAQVRLAQVVHFTGAVHDVGGLLAGAEVVWIPSRADTGRQVALEALAAGRPVVAARLPGLAEIVADGETGLLVPPGDKAALARQTRLLLEDTARRQALGNSGRDEVRRRFPVAAFVQNFAALYQEVAA